MNISKYIKQKLNEDISPELEDKAHDEGGGETVKPNIKFYGRDAIPQDDNQEQNTFNRRNTTYNPNDKVYYGNDLVDKNAATIQGYKDQNNAIAALPPDQQQKALQYRAAMIKSQAQNKDIVNQFSRMDTVYPDGGLLNPITKPNVQSTILDKMGEGKTPEQIKKDVFNTTVSPNNSERDNARAGEMNFNKNHKYLQTLSNSVPESEKHSSLSDLPKIMSSGQDKSREFLKTNYPWVYSNPNKK